MNPLQGRLEKLIGDRWLAVALLLALGGLYGWVMNPDVAGFFYDDGMYLMSGRALWHGEGYRLPLIAGSPLFAKYPPLYPAVLGCLDRLFGALSTGFPGNIAWLKGFNVLLSLASLGVLYRWARHVASLPGWIALGIVLMIAINWRWVFVSTELMSEPLFFLLSLLALMIAEASPAGKGCEEGAAPQRQSKTGWKRLALLVALSTLAFYTRAMGAILILALALWLWLRAGRKQAFWFAAACGLPAAPWVFWSAAHGAQTGQIGDFLIRSFQETYFQSLRMDLRYEYSPWSLFSRGFSELLGNFSVQFFPLLEGGLNHRGGIETTLLTLFTLGLSYTLAVFLGWRAWLALRGGRISPAGLYVALTLAILPCWSFFRFYPRFVLMVLPFLLVFLLAELRAAIPARRAKNTLIAGFLALGLLANVIHLAPYVHKHFRNRLVLASDGLDFWREHESIFRFLRTQTPENALVYTDNGDESYFFALNTGRAAMDFFPYLPRGKLALAGRTPEAQARLLEEKARAQAAAIREMLYREAACHKRARHAEPLCRPVYVIENLVSVTKNSYNDLRLVRNWPPVTALMRAQYPADFTLLVTSPQAMMRLYRFSPVSSRTGESP